MTIDEMQRELDRVLAEREQLRNENRVLVEHVAKQQREIDGYVHRLDVLLRKMFGRRSERVDPAQLELAFLEATGQVMEAVDPTVTALAAQAADDEETAKTKRTRRHGGGGRRRLPENLPVEERHFYPAEAECCGSAMKDLGVEVVELLDFQPAIYRRLRIIKHKRACAMSDHRVVRATAPEVAFADSSVTAAVVASVITAKYGDHLPLHRQVDIAARQGVELSKSTMCGWLAEAAFALAPIHRELKRQMLTSVFVHVDDTGITIQDRQAPGGSRKAYIWSYQGDQGDVVYDYTSRRVREGPLGMLRDYRGFVVADAYSGFDGLFAPGSGRTEVACWAHTRRKFFDAIGTDPRATTAVALIRMMYLVERDAKEATPEERFVMRQEKTTPTLGVLKEWLEVRAKDALPKSPLGEAVRYALNQWTALNVFLTDGRLPLDNNAAERDLRRVAVGRKNWLFAGSDEGAKRAALFFSLVQTCKLNGVDPLAYLTDVLGRLGSTPQSQVFALTPRGWKAARAAATTTTAASA